jgi:hypothetical protein
MAGVKPSPKKRWIKKSIAKTAGKQPDGAGLAKILKKSKAASRYSQVVVTKKVT